MDLPGYVTLTRQGGLMREMQVIANNLANLSTTGYRTEALVFSEMLQALPAEGDSVAMTAARTRFTDERQGALDRTDAPLDLAIEGDGFFQIETAQGPRLTRAGAFLMDATGQVVTAQGEALLDLGGAPIQLPPDAGSISVASDGTLSVDGALTAQIGLVQPAPDAILTREDGVRFAVEGAVEPAEDASVVQGHLEASNVSP
ncbi:MAG: flagellar hook-basal body complex protein, partial [Pseudomonadota bacterium]